MKVFFYYVGYIVTCIYCILFKKSIFFEVRKNEEKIHFYRSIVIRISMTMSYKNDCLFINIKRVIIRLNFEITHGEKTLLQLTDDKVKVKLHFM